jgi:Na+/H+ antiporter
VEGIVLILTLLVAVLVVVEIADRIGVSYPILLVIGGLGLGGLGLALVPGLPTVVLEPDLVLLVLLPPLLFEAAFLTPLRDLRANFRPIALLSIGLVLFTIAVVGVVAHAAIPDLGWPGSFALGAIVAPTDAIAATSIFRRLNVPRRIITILEGESLLNDAVALVAYRAAVAAVLSSTFSIGPAVADFGVAAVGGVAMGVAVGVVVREIYRRLSNPPVEVALSLVIPYAAYLPADQLHLSGVLAVVVAGLIMGRASARLLSADTRVLGLSTWAMLSFLLNGFAFILVGLQLPVVLRGLANRSPIELVGLVLLISATVILVRIVWVFPATYLPRRLFRKIREADPAPPWRATFVVSWAGLRGAVSLAAALALPIDFPERNLVILLAFAVIVATLVGQGLTLPVLLGGSP